MSYKLSDSTTSTNSENSKDLNWETLLLNNKYVILKKIDSGAYATVWLSLNIVTYDYCAIKIHNSEDYKAGKKETKMYDIFKKYNSPYIMSLIDSFDYEHDNEIYHCCVMELMACSLYNLIDSKKYKNGLDFNLIMLIVKQMLEALQKIHDENIIHGDIKPENVLIVGNSNNQKKLFEKLKINDLVNRLKTESKLQKIKNRKNKKHNLSNSNNLNFQNKLVQEIRNILNNNTNDSNDSNDSVTSTNETHSAKYSTENSTENSTNSSESTYVNSIEISSEDISSNSSNLSDDLSDLSDLSDMSDCVDEDDDIVPNDIFKNVKIKLADMGGCLLPNKSKKGKIQTCYYRSPEIILGLDYDTSSDIWALGCSIYELLSGEILFDPHYKKGNSKRHHMYLITKKLGKMIPLHLFESSPYRDIFFTANNKLIKGYKSIDFTKSIWDDLKDISLKNNLDLETTTLFIDFMSQLLEYDPKKRLSVSDALHHKIFDAIKFN